MPCTPIRLGPGAYAIVCTKGRRAKPCAFCGQPCVRLCDWPAAPGRTCDKPMCAAHAHSVGPEIDLCPLHAPPRQRRAHPFGTDIFAPLVPQPVRHPLGCPRCDAGLCHGCPLCRGERPHRIAPRRLPGPWVAVVGARDHANLGQLDEPIALLPKDTVVVSGGARGIDDYAVERAKARGLRTVVLDADWNRLGKVAGFVRNGEVVTVVDGMIAARWWGCRGTLDTIAKANAVGLAVMQVKPLAAQLEVWTTRLSAACRDPDLLDITNMTARAFRAAAGEKRTKQERVRALYREARAWEAEGMSLVDAQRRAKESGLPSLGAVWAPSSKLLVPALKAIQELGAAAERANLQAAAVPPGQEAAAAVARQATLEEVRARAVGVWGGYSGAFLEEMRERFKEMPEAWGWLLGRRRVVLACTCARPAWLEPVEPWDRCHRFLVADALAKCGARNMGELPDVNPHSAQLSLSG